MGPGTSHNKQENGNNRLPIWKMVYIQKVLKTFVKNRTKLYFVFTLFLLKLQPYEPTRATVPIQVTIYMD